MTHQTPAAPIPLTALAAPAEKLPRKLVALARSWIAEGMTAARLARLTDRHLRDIGLTRADVTSPSKASLPSQSTITHPSL